MEAHAECGPGDALNRAPHARVAAINVGHFEQFDLLCRVGLALHHDPLRLKRVRLGPLALPVSLLISVKFKANVTYDLAPPLLPCI